MENLRKVGLAEDEARIYELLIAHGAKNAGQLLKLAGKIKRSTLYQVLRSLGDKGLVSEQKKKGAILFSPEAPDALLKISEARRIVAEDAHRAVQAALAELKEKFFISMERPAIRFYEGVDGLKEIYELHLSTGKDLLFIRTSQARLYRHHFGKWWGHYLSRRAKKGIKTYAITPDDPDAAHDPAIDKLRKVVRTWIRPEDYAAPVEINIFGNFVAIISYGKAIFGLTMENAPVAAAFKDFFRLAERGAKTIEVKHDHGKSGN